MDPAADVTRMLRAWSDGQPVDQDRLLALVYQQLRGLAQKIASDGKPMRSLHPTALVHEAYLKLVHAQDKEFNNRGHFLAVAGRAMRQVIADHAKAQRREKRGGGRQQVTLDPEVAPSGDPAVDLVALNDACERLAALDARQAQIVELRFFAGLQIEEIAAVLGVSESTVAVAWRGARAWLRRELAGDDARES